MNGSITAFSHYENDFFFHKVTASRQKRKGFKDELQEHLIFRFVSMLSKWMCKLILLKTKETAYDSRYFLELMLVTW